MGPKEVLDTKTNWSTDCRPQDGLHLLPNAYTIMYRPVLDERPTNITTDMRSI
jgi:hypothetical protein